jgi:hypothetical protein
MTSDLLDESRGRGAVLEQLGPGTYRVHGDDEAGARLVQAAIEQDVREWCREVNDG